MKFHIHGYGQSQEKEAPEGSLLIGVIFSCYLDAA